MLELTINYLVCAHYHATENTLQKPQNTQALMARTIITARTKYGALPASLNSLSASKLGTLRFLSSLIN